MDKMTKSLLFEAYRRNEMANDHERAKPITQRWLGLGTAAAYRNVLKGGLMVFHDGRTPPPRCMGWLCLTDVGLDTMRTMESEFSHCLADMRKAGYKSSLRANFMLAGGFSSR